jgi:hypothetical protein
MRHRLRMSAGSGWPWAAGSRAEDSARTPAVNASRTPGRPTTDRLPCLPVPLPSCSAACAPRGRVPGLAPDGAAGVLKWIRRARRDGPQGTGRTAHFGAPAWPGEYAVTDRSPVRVRCSLHAKCEPAAGPGHGPCPVTSRTGRARPVPTAVIAGRLTPGPHERSHPSSRRRLGATRTLRTAPGRTAGCHRVRPAAQKCPIRLPLPSSSKQPPDVRRLREARERRRPAGPALLAAVAGAPAGCAEAWGPYGGWHG